MKKLILLISILCLFALQSCNFDESYHENKVFAYELVYKVHYPTEVVTETFHFYSHYNSREYPHHGPTYKLTTNRKGTANYLYVFGNCTAEGSDEFQFDKCVISTTMPLQVVELRQIN